MNHVHSAPASHAPIPGSLSLVLPAYNEEGNIEFVVRRAIEVLPAMVDDFEIIVVNDGSKDATPEIIDRLAAEDSRVRPLHQPNKGYGGALTTGFEATTGDYVMFMDSDRQFDIADIKLLAPFVASYDIVAGFRMERSDPLHRRINAEVFNIVVRILFGVHMRDLDCAFKIFRGDMIRSLELTSSGALINAEMQAKLRRQGATLEQVGVPHYPRIAGTATGGNLRVIVHAMGETIILWRRMHRYQPPIGHREQRPYYVLGDALLGAALTVGVAVMGRFLKRRR
ncbi:MAG TPA: glycosyltransferase family 2 protein [Thermomicrobiales bacterium]|nr:glycosyltransferase family 2 protein [Thermomicrobiales bacterium]